ncbi:MAG: hypothetical protein RL033_1911 [Pseudomonadota bacterium]
MNFAATDPSSPEGKLDAISRKMAGDHSVMFTLNGAVMR